MLQFYGENERNVKFQSCGESESTREFEEKYFSTYMHIYNECFYEMRKTLNIEPFAKKNVKCVIGSRNGRFYKGAQIRSVKNEGGNLCVF